MANQLKELRKQYKGIRPEDPSAFAPASKHLRDFHSRTENRWVQKQDRLTADYVSGKEPLDVWYTALEKYDKDIVDADEQAGRYREQGQIAKERLENLKKNSPGQQREIFRTETAIGKWDRLTAKHEDFARWQRKERQELQEYLDWIEEEKRKRLGGGGGGDNDGNGKGAPGAGVGPVVGSGIPTPQVKENGQVEETNKVEEKKREGVRVKKNGRGQSKQFSFTGGLQRMATQKGRDVMGRVQSWIQQQRPAGVFPQQPSTLQDAVGRVVGPGIMGRIPIPKPVMGGGRMMPVLP